MKKVIWILVIILVIAGVVLWMKQGSMNNLGDNGTGSTATTTQVGSQSLSDGTIQFNYPADFGLAVTQAQLSGMVHSYIPPCNENFDYCLYYNGQDFAGSNFESAGIRISKRTDLAAERLCLNTPPAGYTNMTPSTKSYDNYSASIFSPIGDAGAGHYASGELYRVFLRQANKCYELETRIGETQYANYPAGSIKQFTDSDRNVVYAKFKNILASLEIASNSEKIVLPDPQN